MDTIDKTPALKLDVNEWSEEIFTIHLSSPLTRICFSPKERASRRGEVKEVTSEVITQNDKTIKNHIEKTGLVDYTISGTTV